MRSRAVPFTAVTHYLQEDWDSYNPVWLQTMLSHIGGDDKACLKTVQAINKGMSLTGMLVSSSCETALWGGAAPQGGTASCAHRGASTALGTETQNWDGETSLRISPPQNKSSAAVKCCHSRNRIIEGQRDAMMCPRFLWLTVRGAPWSPGHHPVCQGPWLLYQSRIFEGWICPLLSQLGAQHHRDHHCSLEISTFHSYSSQHLSLAENLH